MNERLRRSFVRLAWLGCAILLALGSAGIVAGGVHQPGTEARPELTWAADEAIRPGLAGAVDDLDRLAADVEGLGELGRLALVAIVGRDLTALPAAVADGGDLVSKIEGETTALRSKLAALPGVGQGSEGRLGPDVRARHEALLRALDATSGLAESWDTLTTGSIASIRLTTLLADHDRFASEGARLGRASSYTPALAQLARAQAALVDARRLRDQLFNTVDVSVLTRWIDRNAALDTALVRLYTALRASKGRTTDEVAAAITAEQKAESLLPPDTRGLVIIMADIAQGGLNQAVIAIELAKGRLNAAVDAIQAPAPGASPTASPGR